jgi:hypothetical protein
MRLKLATGAARLWRRSKYILYCRASNDADSKIHCNPSQTKSDSFANDALAQAACFRYTRISSISRETRRMDPGYTEIASKSSVTHRLDALTVPGTYRAPRVARWGTMLQ